MIEFLTNQYENTSIADLLIEALVFVTGILSVWFAKRENIWVYPTGLIATVLTSYLLFKAGYFGDMLVNVYFSVMSIYGWYRWSGASQSGAEVKISRTTSMQKLTGILLFMLTIFVVFGIYEYFNYSIAADNYIDIFTSGLFFTAMWFMALKKIENWTLWIIGDLIVVPLYAYRGLGMLSLQYLIFTALAIAAYIEWKRILNNNRQTL